MVKKIFLSILSGLTILVITWKYQNYDFSFSVEDAFIKKIFFWKDKLYSSPPKQKTDFVFINTGKDLALVEDTIDYGTVVVSDREKIYRFVHYLNDLGKKPLFSVIDIQFYYPFTKDPLIDSLLEAELKSSDKFLIPIVRDADGNYKKPLYDVRYAYSNYRTFGTVFNKFRIMNQGEIPSIPLLLHETISKAVYKDHFFFPTCNGILCLSSVWPSYYIKNKDITGINYETQVQDIEKNSNTNKTGKITAQYYNVGEILFDLDADGTKYADFFEDKIVILGNFEDDVHTTPVGKMAGPVLLANIYLSLLNGQHMISIWFLLTLLAVFSGISYIAWFKKIPELKLNFKFLFSSYLVKFIRGYISYFGCMFFLSVLVLIVFNVQVALFLPSFIFTGIEYIRQKKYKPKKVTGGSSS